MDLTRPIAARTRSISAENPTGAPGGGGRAHRGEHSTAYASQDLPVGWKRSPCVDLEPHQTRVLADIDGPGVIQHIWMTTLPQHWRSIVLTITFDAEESPSVCVPLGDFFCQGWATYAPVSSIPVTVAPAGGLNSYWEMPFISGARITVTNLSDQRIDGCFYQITWAQRDVPADSLHFHARWRRSDTLADLEPHTILDGVTGAGHYVGTYLTWETHHEGWWGEGEVKFFLDDDDEFPTICGTGTEDYVGGAWSFEHPAGRYETFTTPYLGMPQVIEPNQFNRAGQRYGLYRWHLQDPICFAHAIRVTVQAMGFRDITPGRERYRSLRDDIASVAYFYAEPGSAQPPAGLTHDELDLS